MDETIDALRFNIYDRALDLIDSMTEFYSQRKNLKGREIRDFDQLCEIIADWSDLTELYHYALHGPDRSTANRNINAKILFSLDYVAALDLVAIVAEWMGQEISRISAHRIAHEIALTLFNAAPHFGAAYRWSPGAEIEEAIINRLIQRPSLEPSEAGIRSILLEPFILPVSPANYGIHPLPENTDPQGQT